MNLDQFRARPLVVTVKELCPCCNVLKEGVAMRKTVTSSMYSCEPCFDTVKRNQEQALEDYYAW